MARSAVGRQLISPFRRLTEKTQESGSLTHGLSALITPPSEYLQRVRWMLLLACLAIALFTGFIIIFVSQAILPLRVLGITALACLCWWWFRCVYCATVKDPWRFPVEALALVPAIASLENTTMAIISLAYLGVSFRAFYSTRRQMLLIVLGVSIAYLVARVLLPSGSSPLLISQVILQSFSLFVIAYALSSLSKALAKRDTAIKLESSLLQASTKLLAAQHPEEIYAVALQAVLEMFDNVQVRAGIALGTAQQMILVATRKALIPATSMHGDIVIDLRQLPAKSAAAFVNGASCELVASDVTSQISEVFVPPSGSLFVAPMIIQGTTAGAFLVGYEGPMSRARCTSLEALTRLVALALEKAEIIQDQSLKETEERFVSLVQNSSDIITIIEADSTIRYQSPSVSRILGHQEDKLIGTKLAALVHPEDAQKLTDFLNDVKLKPGRSSGIECRLRQWDGNWRHIETVGTNLLHDPSVQGILLNSRDVTERHALEGQLAQLAFHDPLTNLPNRVLFMDRLQHALLRAERSTKELAVLFLDLDNFKVVNDSMGHHAGDQLLKEVVSRLIAVLRLEDTAARFGGDEFTVLLEDFDAANSPAIVAERIQEQLQTPIKLSGQDVFVTTSIGIAISSGGMDSPDSLLRSADLAMYAAKTKGKAGYAVFDPAMNSRMMERLNLQAEMRHALDRGEFRVFYQPVVEMTTGKILEVEALVRWEHPVRGLVSPAQFIPLAEETGFIIFLGHWVLETAAYQIHNVADALAGQPDADGGRKPIGQAVPTCHTGRRRAERDT